jgi:hypothetical protein
MLWLLLLLLLLLLLMGEQQERPTRATSHPPVSPSRRTRHTPRHVPRCNSPHIVLPVRPTGANSACSLTRRFGNVDTTYVGEQTRIHGNSETNWESGGVKMPVPERVYTFTSEPVQAAVRRPDGRLPTPDTMRNWHRRGKGGHVLPVMRSGGRYYVALSDLRAFLDATGMTATPEHAAIG